MAQLLITERDYCPLTGDVPLHQKPMTVSGTNLHLNGRIIAVVGGPEAVMPLTELKAIAEQIAAAWNASLTPKGTTDGEEKES